MHLKIYEAEDIVHTLSKPSKMPGYSYGLPARECITGSKLVKVPGSVCHGCYALKGFYRMPAVQKAEYLRLDSLDNPAWVDTMISLILSKVSMDDPYFRWHDSGDLQSVDHLQKIVDVCLGTPMISHWLPTREYAIVRSWLLCGGIVPNNLSIRLSAHMIDGPIPGDKLKGIQVSSVSTDDSVYPDANQCPARHQDNACGDCRTCWNKDIYHVSYHKH